MEIGEMTGLVIRKLFAPDLNVDFFTTLEALSQINPNNDKIDYGAVLRYRFSTGVDTFIAVLDGKIVGTASLLLERKFTWGGGLVGHIEDVAVHRDCQKSGVGSAMMTYLIEYAKSKKCRKLILDCATTTAPFYEKQGFHVHEVSMRLDLPQVGHQ